MSRDFQKIRGFSLIEMLVALAVGSVIIVALTMFVGRAFNVSREHFEQVRITEEAGTQLDRIVDSLRNARNKDCNGDGQTTEAGEYWLQGAQANLLTILTNADSDEEVERVVFFSDGSELKRTVTQLDGSCQAVGSPETIVMTRFLRNATEGEDLFEYYKKGSGSPELMADPESALREVAFVNTKLIIDVEEQQYPPAIRLATATSPRGNGNGMCPAKEPITIEKTATGNFIADAFNECLDYCGTYEDASGAQYCPWMGVPVVADATGGSKTICLCEQAHVPSGLNDNSNNCRVSGSNSITDYTRRCWGEDTDPGANDNRICAPDKQGVVYSDMKGMDPGSAGECGCQCKP